MTRLQLMVRSAEAGDGGASLNKVVASEPEGTLSRLLYSGADISSVTVDAEPSTVHAISMVRGVLNSALSRAAARCLPTHCVWHRRRSCRWFVSKQWGSGAIFPTYSILSSACLSALTVVWHCGVANVGTRRCIAVLPACTSDPAV